MTIRNNLLLCIGGTALLIVAILPAIAAFTPSSTSTSMRHGAARCLLTSTLQRCDLRLHETPSPRRNFFADSAGKALLLSSAAATASSGTPGPASASGPDTTATDSSCKTSTSTTLLADVPMIRLHLPAGGVGRDYVAVQLKINGQGPFEFLLDTGLTTELVTPHLQQLLGNKGGKTTRIQGLAAGGGTETQDLIELNGASLYCGADHADLPLPQPLHAAVTDFPQEHLDPAHDPIEGMLGMELLSLFDVDLDFSAGRIRFYKPGTAAKSLDMTKWVEIPSVVINETGLLGIRVRTAESSGQPILGFLDCGSTFSTINWAAADILGLPPKGDAQYAKQPSIQAMGVDGRPLILPMIPQRFTFAGDIVKDASSGRIAGFEAPPSQFKPWDPVRLAVGNLPAFTTVLGDGIHPYTGPAALIGLDVLAQRRILLEAGSPGARRRRIFVRSSA